MLGAYFALHEAAVVQLLLRTGADKSFVDGQGKTPADLARERRLEAVAQMEAFILSKYLSKN